MKVTELKLEELAERAGVSPRTVRYYIQRGLLTPPAFRGAGTSYGEEHLTALRAIKKLQEAYWPLDAIAVALASKSPAELERIASGRLVPTRDGSTPITVPKAAERTPVHPYREVAAKTTTTRVRVERIRLAEGVELSIDEGASEQARTLAERIVRAVETGVLATEGRTDPFTDDGVSKKKGGRR